MSLVPPELEWLMRQGLVSLVPLALEWLLRQGLMSMVPLELEWLMRQGLMSMIAMGPVCQESLGHPLLEEVMEVSSAGRQEHQ
jgi:hypothetical protein